MRLCDIPPPSEQLLQDTEHSFYVCLAGSLTLDVAFEKRKLKRGDWYEPRFVDSLSGVFRSPDKPLIVT
jgi:hypothetical protein